MVKSHHFCSSASTQTNLQVRRSVSSERSACFFSLWSQLVAGIIFRFLLIDLSGYFSRSAVQAPHFYNSFHTNVPTGQTECLIWTYERLFYSSCQLVTYIYIYIYIYIYYIYIYIIYIYVYIYIFIYEQIILLKMLISEEVTSEIVIFVVFTTDSSYDSSLNSKSYILQPGDIIFTRL